MHVCLQRRLCKQFTLSRFTLFRMPSNSAPVPVLFSVLGPIWGSIQPVRRSLHFYASLAFKLISICFCCLSIFSQPSFAFVWLLFHCCQNAVIVVAATAAAVAPAPATAAAGILVFCRLTCWSSSSSLAFCLQFALPIDKEEARRRLSWPPRALIKTICVLL